MRTLRKTFCGGCLLLLVLGLCACERSDDATAASQQMTTTAADLNGYYTSLAESESDTIALNELDDSIFQIPFDAQSRGIIQDTMTEIAKRQESAQKLAELAASISALTGSTISSDVSTAATALGNELVNVKALPGGSPV